MAIWNTQGTFLQAHNDIISLFVDVDNISLSHIEENEKKIEHVCYHTELTCNKQKKLYEVQVECFSHSRETHCVAGQWA